MSAAETNVKQIDEFFVALCGVQGREVPMQHLETGDVLMTLFLDRVPSLALHAQDVANHTGVSFRVVRFVRDADWTDVV